VRIRIRRPIAGIVDGISLGHFVPGAAYDVPDSLGGYLITTGDAVTAAASEVEPEGDEIGPLLLLGGVTITNPLDTAHDRKRTRRRVRRRRVRRRR
jgi:hypothetical protein